MTRGFRNHDLCDGVRQSPAVVRREPAHGLLGLGECPTCARLISFDSKGIIRHRDAPQEYDEWIRERAPAVLVDSPQTKDAVNIDSENEVR